MRFVNSLILLGTHFWRVNRKMANIEIEGERKVVWGKRKQKSSERETRQKVLDQRGREERNTMKRRGSREETKERGI